MQTTEDVTGRWVGRTEALERLGVKTQTLYAYVSRGRLVARPDPADSRRSLYDVDAIDRLQRGEIQPPAAGTAKAKAVPRGEADVDSSVSVFVDGRLFYRGRDAMQLAQQATLEEAAGRLWGAGDTNIFAGQRPRIDGVIGLSIRARMFASLARRAHEDVTSMDGTADALRAQAASIMNEVIDAAAGPGPRLHFHQRLARGWKAIDRDAHLIRRALVLAADDGFDPSVLAVRSAAGGGAPLAGAALAGIVTLAGSAAIGEIAEVTAWVNEARRDPAGAMRRRMQATGTLPGFSTYREGHSDPRASALLSVLDLSGDLAAVVHEGERASGQPPTFALALAVLARRLDLPREGAADLFLLGRLAGLLGHALDQATNGSPIRARLRYVGPEPGAN